MPVPRATLVPAKRVLAAWPDVARSPRLSTKAEAWSRLLAAEHLKRSLSFDSEGEFDARRGAGDENV